MNRLNPVFDTPEEAERLHGWFFSLTDEERDEYRKQKAREELIDEAKEGSRVIGRLVLIVVLIGVAIDLLWRTWDTVARTFPTWNIPLVSLHQSISICLLFGGAVVATRLAIKEIRKPL